MSSVVIAVWSVSRRRGTQPLRRSISASMPGARPLSLRRSVGSIATTKPCAVATCTFQAGYVAPSAMRIVRTSGSESETFG
jgi:hypothetical protein